MPAEALAKAGTVNLHEGTILWLRKFVLHLYRRA